MRKLKPQIISSFTGLDCVCAHGVGETKSHPGFNDCSLKETKLGGPLFILIKVACSICYVKKSVIVYLIISHGLQLLTLKIRAHIITLMNCANKTAA